MIALRPATEADVLAYFGKPLPYSARAIVAERDGEILGVAGILLAPQPHVFSDIRDEMRRHRRIMVRACREVQRMVQAMRRPVVAIAHPSETTAPALLNSLGFSHIRDVESGGVSRKVYQWVPR